MLGRIVGLIVLLKTMYSRAAADLALFNKVFETRPAMAGDGGSSDGVSDRLDSVHMIMLRYLKEH